MVRVFVVLHEVRPVGQRCDLQARLSERRSVFRGEVDELEYCGLERIADFGESDALSLQHSHPGSLCVALRGHPAAEACAVRGDGGNPKRHGFEWGVSPGLVERREDAKVGSGKQIPVLVADQWVGAVQVDRDMHDVDPCAMVIVETERVQLVRDRIVRLVDEIVRAPQRRAGRCAVGAVPELTLRLGVTCGEHGVHDHAFPVAGLQLLGHIKRGIEVDVHALVDVLVAAGEREDQRIVAVVLIAGGELGELEELLSGQSLLIWSDWPGAKPVRQDHVGASPEKVLAFERCNLADRGEDVGFACRNRFHRVLRRDPELPGGGLGVDARQRFVEVGVRAPSRERAAEHRRVRRENRPDLRGGRFQVQDRAGRHPLVGLYDGALSSRQ